MHSKTSRARIGRSERATRALELRKAGNTFAEIGRAMGFSEQRAHRVVTQELFRLNAKRAELAAEVTRLELERLDTLIAAIWEQAKGGDGPAIDRVLSIMSRRARLIGLDAPTKIAPTTPDGQELWAPILKDLSDAELDIMTKLAGRARQVPVGGNNHQDN